MRNGEFGMRNQIRRRLFTPHSEFPFRISAESRRLELNQYLAVFSGALDHLSYIGLSSFRIPNSAFRIRECRRWDSNPQRSA